MSGRRRKLHKFDQNLSLDLIFFVFLSYRERERRSDCNKRRAARPGYWVLTRDTSIKGVRDQVGCDRRMARTMRTRTFGGGWASPALVFFFVWLAVVALLAPGVGGWNFHLKTLMYMLQSKEV